MAARTVIAFAVLAVVAGPATARSLGWSQQTDAETGYSYSYPSAVFSPVSGDEKPAFHYFESDVGAAKLMVGAWDNEAGDTPTEFKRWLIENAGGYEEVTYRPHGKSWFVLSGYRGEDIYYEKVMFSCAGRLVNVLGISYPSAQRSLYDPIVERLEDSFSPGRRC
jgi:hypothetical protein